MRNKRKQPVNHVTSAFMQRHARGPDSSTSSHVNERVAGRITCSTPQCDQHGPNNTTGLVFQAVKPDKVVKGGRINHKEVAAKPKSFIYPTSSHKWIRLRLSTSSLRDTPAGVIHEEVMVDEPCNNLPE